MTLPTDASLVRLGLQAVLAGARIAERAGTARQVINHKGNLRDIVTEADIQISHVIEQQLAASGLPVLSEENELASGTGVPRHCWVIDPIDGSVNFAHGLTQYAVSAGLIGLDEFRLGFVCAPALNELYFTLDPQSALFNGKPFSHVHRTVKDALTAASFSAMAPPAQFDLLHQVNQDTRGCLRSGSAALNLCWTAAGKLQAAYGFQAKLWDVAGGLAIASAAGCDVVLRRQPDSLMLDYIVGSREVVGHISALARQLGLWE